MENILSGFLDTVLGPSEHSSKTNRKYVCPFHHSSTGKKKLEVDIVTDESGVNKWHCWSCGVKGKSIRSLLWKMNVDKSKFVQLDKIIRRTPNHKNENEVFNGILPEEYVPIFKADSRSIIVKHAKSFLKKRGLSDEDVMKYQIGYCDDGDYAERIIIPSYDAKGQMNFFVGRTFMEDGYMKYKYPKFSRDIIPFEMYINWELPIILCEGGFDMMAIKRNVIPLFGKSITPKLKKKLITSKIREVYVVLDIDAIDTAIKHCEELLSYGKAVYLIVPEDGKDPSDMGFRNFTKMIQKAVEVTSGDLMKLKMQLFNF